jgi:RNA polymerase sigma factor (sigma-70 family)
MSFSREGISGNEPQWFATTHWTVVLAAKAEGVSGDALERLCTIYWRPIYSYIRREGYIAADAEDLTQGFFGQLFQKDYLQHLRHQNGKFRSFLLTFLKHFLSDERDKAAAQKRGGSKKFISLDHLLTEEVHVAELSNHITPEELFDRRWAETLLNQAIDRLKAEYERRGNGLLFASISDFEPNKHGAKSHAEVGIELGMSETAVKSAVHRLRARHREILREEIAHTVATPEEIDGEIQHLLSVMSR